VLSRGDEFVFAQNIAQVVNFLKLNEKTGRCCRRPACRAMDRYRRAIRMIAQMPDDKLDTEVPNRPRAYRVLAHTCSHPEAFVETPWRGVHARPATAVPLKEDMASATALADYGRRVRPRWPGGG